MSDLTLHHFDHVSGVFLQSTVVPPRPRGVGLPAGCTLVPPPAEVPPGYVARWTGDAWEVVPALVAAALRYGYDARTGLCTGLTESEENSTTVAPPDFAPGQAVVWDGSGWTLVEDHRGQTLYSTVDGSAGMVADVGAIPDGFTLTPYPGAGYSWDGQAWVPDLPTAKALARAAITARGNAIMAALAVEYGEFERQTWDQQSIEARALQADPDADAPLVRAIALARGMDVAELAGRILANEAAWKVASGAIVGHRLRLQDALDACADVAAVEALDIETGWPGV